jgi:tRNA 2-thiouridine synthesizing protein A
MLAMMDNHPKAGHSAPGSVAHVIDARGLACPLPVLKLRKILLGEPAGTAVQLLATDRAALRDVPAFCESTGHTLVAATDSGGVLTFTVRRG